MFTQLYIFSYMSFWSSPLIVKYPDSFEMFTTILAYPRIVVKHSSTVTHFGIAARLPTCLPLILTMCWWTNLKQSMIHLSLCLFWATPSPDWFWSARQTWFSYFQTRFSTMLSPLEARHHWHSTNNSCAQCFCSQ